MALLERHVGFIDALRQAGMPVSVAEGLDAVRALGAVGWDDREAVREVYATTLVKRQSRRATFDAVFDLWFPALLGEGVGADERADERGRVDTPAQLADLRDRVAQALVSEATGGSSGSGSGGQGGTSSGTSGASGSPRGDLKHLATEAVGRFGRMPGRAPDQQGWSAYNAMRRLGTEEIVRRIAEALKAEGLDATAARRQAEGIVKQFEALVAADALRRLAAERDPAELVRSTVRPTIEKLDFSAAKREEIEEMRRMVMPLARRLAARLTQEQHSRRRGPLDFRRTVRASMATGGVPLDTYQRPKRPHRTDLVVLCDVSGSVASFAQFTLLLVLALREQFTGVRAFTFVDDVAEVTDALKAQADPIEVMNDLAQRSAHAARFGRTNYGAAFRGFRDRFGDALGPRSTLLVLGDARSNYADLNEADLAAMVSGAKQAFWLNPEHPRHWGSGDSAAPEYGAIVAMTECRNLEQLAEFVHDLV